MKKFKKLRGNRVYLELPKKEETKIIVDENTKEELAKKALKHLSRLKVYAVGDAIELADIKVGDEVLIDPLVINRAAIIPLDEDFNVALVNGYDIIHIW